MEGDHGVAHSTRLHTRHSGISARQERHSCHGKPREHGEHCPALLVAIGGARGCAREVGQCADGNGGIDHYSAVEECCNRRLRQGNLAITVLAGGVHHYLGPRRRRHQNGFLGVSVHHQR